MRRQTPEDVINTIAQRYHVELVFLTEKEWDSKFDGTRSEEKRRGYEFGPIAHCINVKEQAVYIQPHHVIESDLPHVLLHEVMHIATFIPWVTLDDQPEELTLMPLERCVARALFDESDYIKTVKWQEETRIMGGSRTVGDEAGYRSSTFWRVAYQVARIAGALDSKNRPTWERPNWKRLDHDELDSLLAYYYEVHHDDPELRHREWSWQKEKKWKSDRSSSTATRSSAS